MIDSIKNLISEISYSLCPFFSSAMQKANLIVVLKKSEPESPQMRWQTFIFGLKAVTEDQYQNSKDDFPTCTYHSYAILPPTLAKASTSYTLFQNNTLLPGSCFFFFFLIFLFLSIFPLKFVLILEEEASSLIYSILRNKTFIHLFKATLFWTMKIATIAWHY